MHARPIQVQTKVHFKNLQFLAVTYDMGFLRLSIPCCLNGSAFFPLFNQILETEMTLSQSIIVR